MNRKETQLLVENWRKVLDEGLYDYDPEILEEINLKSLGHKSIGLLMLALTATTALTPNQASAKFTNIPAKTQMQALKSIESAVESGKIRKSRVESLIKLGALIQSDEEFKATPEQIKLVDDFADDFVDMINDLVDEGMAKKKEAKAAEAVYDELADKAGIDRSYPGLRKATVDYEILMDELRDILNRIKALDSVSNQFNFETQALPDGFKEIYSMVDKATGKIKSGGETEITGN